MSDDRFSVTLMRSATAFGWSPRIRFDLVVNNLVAHAVTTGRILLKSDGTPWRALVHIEDISRAFVAVAQARRELVHDQAFNVGQTNQNYRVREIAEMVAEIVPNCAIEHAPGAGPDPRCYRVNCDKLPRVLPEFRPTWSARDGARQVLEMVRKVGLKPGEFEGARYARLPHIKNLIADGVMDERFRCRSSNIKAA
jgi:nucleoside-diphosphate-sugar epimerase